MKLAADIPVHLAKAIGMLPFIPSVETDGNEFY